MVADEGRLRNGRTAPATAGVHFTILLAAALSVSTAYGVTLPVLPFIVERAVGANAAVIARRTGTLTGIYTFALLIFSPLWGAVSDRIDRRSIIAIGLIGSGISLLLLDFATTLSTLYVARGSSGALSAAVLPSVLAYVAEASQAPDRPRKFAVIASATTFGFLLGPAIGSWLSPMVLAPLSVMRIAGFLMSDSPFFALALANLLSAAALLFLPALAECQSASLAVAGDKPKPVDQPRIYFGLLLTCIAVFGITVAEVGITLLGKQVLSLRPEGIARFFPVCGVVMIAVQIAVFPICMRKFALPSLIAFSMTVVAAGLGLIPYARAVVSILLAFAFVSAGTALLIPALATLISNAAGPLQGKAMGQQVSSANLGQALAASLTTPAAPFVVSAILAGAGTLIAGRMLSAR
jgi:MFS family permease